MLRLAGQANSHMQRRVDESDSRAAFGMFFFVVFFSMEPIREEILKQIAAACSVSGGVLRFDPVKLA